MISQKEELRRWVKLKRKEVNAREKYSDILAEKLINSNEFKKAKNILIYYPLTDEIDLLSITSDISKNFYLPKIEGKNLLCCPYKSGEKLCISCCKTLEPLTEACDKNLIDLAVIPALACDKNNYRLGYGGGFYDRFLQDFNGTKIVCLPKEFLLDTVHPEKHDIKVDKIISN